MRSIQINFDFCSSQGLVSNKKAGLKLKSGEIPKIGISGKFLADIEEHKNVHKTKKITNIKLLKIKNLAWFLKISRSLWNSKESVGDPRTKTGWSWIERFGPGPRNLEPVRTRTEKILEILDQLGISKPGTEPDQNREKFWKSPTDPWIPGLSIWTLWKVFLWVVESRFFNFLGFKSETNH